MKNDLSLLNKAAPKRRFFTKADVYLDPNAIWLASSDGKTIKNTSTNNVFDKINNVNTINPGYVILAYLK